MYCKTCGKEIPDGAYVCPYCGQQVNSQPSDDIAQRQRAQFYAQNMQNVPPVSNVSAPPTGKMNVCALLGLIFGCVAAFLTLLANILIWTATSLNVLGFVGFCSVFAQILAWPGLVLSIVGMCLLKRFGHKGLAIAALVVCSALIVFFIVNWISNAVLFSAYV